MARPVGSRNVKTQVWLDKVNASGVTPVEFLLERFRDESEDLSVRIDCAKAAAPYCHPKIMAIAHANLTPNGEETETVGLPRISEILDELIGSRIASNHATLVPNGPVLPAEIRPKQA